VFSLPRSLVCRAESAEEMEAWIDVINNLMKYRNAMTAEDLEDIELDDES
jgi:hypothetical protein